MEREKKEEKRQHHKRKWPPRSSKRSVMWLLLPLHTSGWECLLQRRRCRLGFGVSLSLHLFSVFAFMRRAPLRRTKLHYCTSARRTVCPKPPRHRCRSNECSAAAAAAAAIFAGMSQVCACACVVFFHAPGIIIYYNNFSVGPQRVSVWLSFRAAQ